jgi:regulator of protease activity HflC (stomatin/prohibitin superfamily)
MNMLFLKSMLIVSGIAMMIVAAGILGYDLYLQARYRRESEAGVTPAGPQPKVAWRASMALVLLAWGPILMALSIVVVPSGTAGVRVSETKGTLAGALYPGVHLVPPLIESVVLFDSRDQLFTTGAPEDGAKGRTETGAKFEPLKLQAKEGLTLALAITVRYRLDSKRLDFILTNLPQPVEKEIVPQVVASVWRDLVPNYTVREVFAVKREEIRRRAARAITERLASDAIIVKEVMLRDIQLPPEYAKGLEELLLKEQESDQKGVETDIQQKQVRISELEAEAQKAQRVKQAEGEAQVRVLEAKSEADAIEYTLPLKQKQIEESRLEAEARKEATVKNAEAMAQAKVIDSKAEMDRRKMLADAEADRIRVTAAADAERLKSEAAILKSNPLLINKIVAERLSDKLQIMMVPADGKFFFANDVLRSMSNANHVSQSQQADEDTPDPK